MPSPIRPEGPEPDDFRFSRRALATGALSSGVLSGLVIFEERLG